MRSVTIAVLALAFLPASVAAQGSERLNDQQLTRLVENVGKSFDHWKDDLEKRDVDDAKISNASGVIDVKKFVNDMKKDIETVDGRLKSSYAANPEVTAMLRRASDVERRYASQPQGAPDAWKGLSGQLKALAAAYGLPWPVDTAAANAQRRMDGELASEVKRIASGADQLRNVALKAASDAKQPKSVRDQADASMKEWKKSAELLADNLNGHRAVLHDATRMLELTQKSLDYVKTVGPLKPEGVSAISTINSVTPLVTTAFALTKP